MARQLLKRLLKASRRLKSRRTAGFTLLELLVAVIIGALITFLLMGLVIDLAEANQRDASRSQVQQDMQTAIDYIAQDLREAVFVYNGECLQNGAIQGESRCPGLVNHIPAELNQANQTPPVTPVLAFWRDDPLPTGISQLCADNALAIANGDEANPVVQAGLTGVCLAGRTYALVVYVLDATNDNNWPGLSRILRFKLTRFPDNAATPTDVIPGYVDPIRDSSLSFQQWPLDKSGVNEQVVLPNLNSSPAPVLVDFVARTGTFNADPPSCADFIDTTKTPPPNAAPALSPLGSTNPSFYVCVRGGGIGDYAIAGQNQDVLLSLSGNLIGKPGYTKNKDYSPPQDLQIAPVQTRVLVRGVTGK